MIVLAKARATTLVCTAWVPLPNSSQGPQHSMQARATAMLPPSAQSARRVGLERPGWYGTIAAVRYMYGSRRPGQGASLICSISGI
eukprot:scaffold459_cov391-Prasinococcus_capsulatus_cf.AAC.1